MSPPDLHDIGAHLELEAIEESYHTGPRPQSRHAREAALRKYRWQVRRRRIMSILSGLWDILFVGLVALLFAALSVLGHGSGAAAAERMHPAEFCAKHPLNCVFLEFGDHYVVQLCSRGTDGAGQGFWNKRYVLGAKDKPTIVVELPATTCQLL